MLPVLAFGKAQYQAPLEVFCKSCIDNAQQAVAPTLRD